MNFFKRSMLSVKRRTNKTILLFLIVFLLGNFISISFAIRNTTESLKNNIKSGLGAIVTIHAKPDDYDLLDIEPSNEIVDIFKQYNANETVKYKDYALTSQSFYSLKLASAAAADYNSEYSPVTMRGINRVDHLDIYQNDIKLLDGRIFTQEEIEQGANVVMVPVGTTLKTDACLMKEDNTICASNEEEIIKVGDKITFERIIDIVPFNYNINSILKYGSQEYEVIGIYQETDPTSENTFMFNGVSETYSSRAFNGMYIPEKTMLREIELQNEYKREYYGKHPEVNTNYSNYFIAYLQIILNDPNKLNQFASDIRLEYLNNGYELNIYSSSDSYDAVAGSIESLSEISSLIIFVSVIVSMVVLGLVITLFVKDRKQEMGIYLSLGEKRRNVLLQIFLETYIVGMLAISLSLFSGDVLGRTLSKEVIIYQNDKQSEVIYEKLELLGAVVYDGLEINTITEEIESNLSVSYVLSIYVVGTLVFVVSTLFPTIYILKLEPKNIML